MYGKFMAWFFYFIISCYIQILGICEQKKAFFYIYVIIFLLIYLPAILVKLKGVFSIIIYDLGKIIITTVFIACLFNIDFFISFEIILFGVCLVE